jgi:hypothetical protein
MDLQQSKDVIMKERDAPFGRVANAAIVLCLPENAGKVSLLELIECLKRGNELKRMNLASEYAALALYARTKRQRHHDGVPYKDLITDADNWLAYLKEQHLI